MFEILALCLLICAAVLFVKFFLLLFKVGFWALMLPLKIVLGLMAMVFVLIFALPAVLITGVLGLLIAPFALLLPLAPFLLILWGLYLLLR